MPAVPPPSLSKNQSDIEFKLNFADRQKIYEEIKNDFEDKSSLLLNKDLISFTVLCLYKPNRRIYQLT